MRPARGLFVFLLLAACGAYQPPNLATVPAGAFGPGNDTDMAAIQLAEFAFADSSRTYGEPAQAARAAAALDYLAGQLEVAPRWAQLPSGTKEDMLRARAAMRAALGIAPNAPSQDVVQDLLAAAELLAAGNSAGAEGYLRPPTFTLGPEQTVRRLSNMPYIREANLATREAADASETRSETGCRTCSVGSQTLINPFTVPMLR